MLANIIKPHPPEVVAQIMADALKIVEGLELDGRLEEIAFTETIRLLGVAAIIPTQQAIAPLGLAIAGRAS